MNAPLTITSLLELIRLFEYASTFLDDQGQRMVGVPNWALSQSSLSCEERANWLVPVGYTNVYPISVDQNLMFADVTYDTDSNQYYYRSAKSFRKCAVALNDLAVVAISSDKLLHYLADLLAIPFAFRTGIQSPAIADVLWYLGKTRIREAWIDIWCARHVSAKTTLIFQHLKNRHLPDKGLVLTFGAALPEVIPPPRQYHFLALKQVVCPLRNGCGIDGDLLHRFLGGTSPQDTDSMLPVRFDAYSNTLVITTKALAPWVIKGTRQRAVVRYLFEQLHKDRQWVASHEILSYVYGAQQQGHSRRISDIFRGNPLWKDYITTSAKGLYGFKLD